MTGCASPDSQLRGDWLRTEWSGESIDVDQGQEQPIGARKLSTDSAGNPRTTDAAVQRRLATGRESQRRFRERQKVICLAFSESGELWMDAQDSV